MSRPIILIGGTDRNFRINSILGVLRMFFNGESLRILAIGAHPDDVEIGAGGFLARAIREFEATVELLVMTCGQPYIQDGVICDRKHESMRGARELGISPDRIEVLTFQARELQNHLHQMIQEIEGRLDAARDEPYDLILTHAAYDTHSDHSEVHKATISAARYFTGSILLYQAPSTIPNEFRPTFFSDLSESLISDKDLAIQAHISQRNKYFTSRQTIETMAKVWAAFLRQPHRYFEAFEVNKSFWRLSQPAEEQRALERTAA